MRIRKYKVDPNLLIALGVLIASFSALFVYIQQAAIMREQTELLLEQTKANAWPYLTIGMSQSNPDSTLEEYSLYLSNRGTGPAIIEGAVITYQGTPLQRWSDLIKLMHVPDSIAKGYSNSILYGQVIHPKEDLRLVDWNFKKELMRYIYSKADKLAIEVCYRSVYDDRWHIKRIGFKTNLEQNIREETDECTLENETLFSE